MTMRVGTERMRLAGAVTRHAAALGLSSILAMGLAHAEARTGSKEQQQYCANIAASSETLRLERRRKELADLESEVAKRLQALETRQNELRSLVDRLDAFERNASEALVGLYSRMKPDAAAAQLAQLDDDISAALVLQLKTKVSSAILGEMDAARAAALAKKISDLRKASAGRKP
jgi:flagellar motility protein MotE (MotC chaperone)